MMRYAVFVAFVALALQASARHMPNEQSYRRSIGDNEIDDSDQHEVRALRHRHADIGYPEFDGNIAKQNIASETSEMAMSVKETYRGKYSAWFSLFKPIVNRVLKSNWKNFDEYLDFMGAALNVAVEETEKLYKIITGEEYSYDSSADGNSNVESVVARRIKQLGSKLDYYIEHNNIDVDEVLFRNGIKDSDIDISDEFEVRAPWHGNADKGYPEFDGNPFKIMLVQKSNDDNRKLLAWYKENFGSNLPDHLKTLEDSLKKNWKNFDEYLEFWGEVREKEMAKKAKENSNDDYNDDSDDGKSI